MFSSQCGPANTFSREATRRRSCRTASINRWRSIYSPGWLRLSSIAGTHPKHRSLRTFSLHFRPSRAWSMANSASNTASARVSPIPVRVLVASRKTIHFQPYGFVVSTTSNWIVLYSMTLIPTSCTKYSSYPNAYRIDAVIPAAMRLATAPSVQSGRPLRETRRIKVSAKSAILLSPTLRPKPGQV